MFYTFLFGLGGCLVGYVLDTSKTTEEKPVVEIVEEKPVVEIIEEIKEETDTVK